MSELLFYKPNELIAVIDQVQVNRLAKHLGNYLLKYAQEQIKFHAHQGNLFEISLADINTSAKVASKNYDEIDTALKKLMQPVTIRNADNPKKYKHCVPIYEIEVDIERGNYKFRLPETMIELLRQTDYFTKLDLHEFNDFCSKHTIVLYEWLKRYEHAHQIPILSLHELRQITNTADKKTYDNFSHVQIRILDVVVAEINGKTPYQVSYEPLKERATRRPKVAAIKFTFIKKSIASDTVPFLKSEARTIAFNSKDNEALTAQIQQIHARYEELADLYVRDGFCEKQEDFYRATYIADFGSLKWFYDNKKILNKKDKLNAFFVSDIQKGKRSGRWQSQQDLYKFYFGKLKQADQKLITDCQAKQGFLEQILILKAHLEDPTKLKNLENWL